MGSHLPKLILYLLVVAVNAAFFPGQAQLSDRSIIFSTPKADNAQTAAPSLIPQNSEPPVLPRSLQAPDPALSFQAPDDLPALPLPAENTSQSLQMKKMLEERKNWTLMTPAEIFGVSPMDELLHPPEHDAVGQEKNPTQLERFLAREEQSRGSFTNGWQNDWHDSAWIFSHDRSGFNVPGDGRDSTIDTAERLSQFLKNRTDIGGAGSRNAKNWGWDSLSPLAQPASNKPDLEQVAAMERFRQMLDPGTVSESEPSPDSKFFPGIKTVPEVDPNITQPDFVPNPAGASFIPLASGIGKPAGLTPLPGITTTPATPPETVPAWAPRPPPWLLQGPQPFIIPQRKF